METNPEYIKIPVSLTLPKQYVGFWEGVRRIYGLPESALEQLATDATIGDLNCIHEMLALKEDIIAKPEIKPSLTIGGEA